MRDTSVRKQANRRGAVVVEMAITLPLVLFILFGSFELSQANFMRHAARAAAYEGARVGILPGADEAQVRDAVQFVLRSLGIRDATIVVTPTVFNATTPDVHVDVRIDASKNLMFSPYFMRNAAFVGECHLTRETY